MEDEAVIEQLPNQEYANLLFLLGQPDDIAPNKNELRTQLLTAIKTNSE
jgi:hypothetical protein